MANWNTAENFIANGRLPARESVVSFEGYSAAGDGGAAQWSRTGDTGTPSQSPAQRGDGTLTDATGAVWEIVVIDYIDIAQLGASTANLDNSAFLSAAVNSNIPVRIRKAYSYDFKGQAITFSSETLDIDFGNEIQTIKNFGGITANNARYVKINGRIDCDNTRFVNMVKCFAVETLNSNLFEIKNVRNVSPVNAEQTFVFEVSNGTVDKTLNANFGSVKVANLITETQDFPNATPMTFMGGFGSSGTNTEKHLINFDEIFAEDFYSVDEADSTTIIGADSDFFRLFTNPTQLNINTLHLKNVGKRFVKTQEQVSCTVVNIYSELSEDFSGANYNGTFDAQNNNSGKPTIFNIVKAEINHPKTSNRPAFFNASGLEHEMTINNLQGSGFGYFINGVNGALNVLGGCISGWRGSATTSKRIYIENCKITDFTTLAAIGAFIKNSEVSLGNDVISSGFALDFAKLENVSLSNWDSNVRVSRTSYIKNVILEYARGSDFRRPFRPDGALSRFTGLRVVQSGGVAIDAAIESGGASGDLFVRDYSSATVGLGFLSSGSYDVILDNCDGTIGGAGVNSLLTATYA